MDERCRPGLMSSSNSTRALSKAVKVEWQNRVASLYWRVLGELHLLGRWIPVEELALVKLDFLPLFKARFVDKVYRAPLVGGTEAWVDFVIVNAEYNCVNSPDGTFSRFNKRPRQWVYVTHCASGGEVGLLMPGAPRHLVELTGPGRLRDIAALTEANEGELAERQTIINQMSPSGDYPGRPPSSASLRAFRNRMYAEFTEMLDEEGANPIAVIHLPAATAAEARSTKRRSNSQILRDTENALGAARRALAAAAAENQRLERTISRLATVADDRLSRLRVAGDARAQATATVRADKREVEAALHRVQELLGAGPAGRQQRVVGGGAGAGAASASAGAGANHRWRHSRGPIGGFTCLHIYVCCMYVCMYVNMYVCTCVYAHACVYERTCTHACVCMYECSEFYR